MFAIDSHGKMGTRRNVNLEENVSGPQSTNFVNVSGARPWRGGQWKTSSYIARFPVMSPDAQVFVYNRAPVARTVAIGARSAVP